MCYLKQNVFCERCCVENTVLPFVGNFWIHTTVIVMHAGVHAMMTLKYLRMRHAYDSDMQTNICNAICMVLCA